MNDYAKRLERMKRDLLNRGMLVGEQYAIDCTMIALHRLGWGYDRIKRLFDLVTELSDYYAETLHLGMEQDVMQERMDRELRGIVKDRQEFADFSARYPDVQTLGYERPVRRCEDG